MGIASTSGSESCTSSLASTSVAQVPIPMDASMPLRLRHGRTDSSPTSAKRSRSPFNVRDGDASASWFLNRLAVKALAVSSHRAKDSNGASFSSATGPAAAAESAAEAEARDEERASGEVPWPARGTP
mmetsp:Transcript_94937/g.263762  ORF Transcript_94937/g.263762 Transcript_94937/m.263762 type:complete len:128 (-) Transcript_94937:543-926(-)